MSKPNKRAAKTDKSSRNEVVLDLYMRAILDVCEGWTSPMTDREKIARIKRMVNEAIDKTLE